MSSFLQLSFTSPESLASSIGTDPFVLRWFTYLVAQPAARSRLAVWGESKKEYLTLKKNFINQIILYFSAGGILCWTIFSQHRLYLLLLICLIYPWFKFSTIQKQCVQKIGLTLLTYHFDETTLCHKTLYQIGEELSRQYRISSLVDTIYAWDNFWRQMILMIALGAIIAYYIFVNSSSGNFWIFYIDSMATAYLIFILAQTIILYTILNHKTQNTQRQ